MELISREEAMRLLKEDLDASRSRGDDERADACFLHYIEISNLPTIEERNVGENVGEWIFKNKARYDDWSEFECSECGNRILATARDFSLHLFDYCSKCGSKMGEKVARRIEEYV